MSRGWQVLMLLLVAWAGAACDSLPFLGAPATATPTATLVPTNTPLPPSPTPSPVPSATPLPPTPTYTSTPAATSTLSATSTLTPTVTRTRVPVTATPSRTATVAATTVPLRFPAPKLLEPGAGASYKIGTNDLVLRWQPVGPLSDKECYRIDVSVINALVSTQKADQSYITGCADPGDSKSLTFVLVRRPPGNDYLGLVARANNPTPSNSFLVRWTVTAVSDAGGGRYNPLSPTSATLEFALREE